MPALTAYSRLTRTPQRPYALFPVRLEPAGLSVFGCQGEEHLRRQGTQEPPRLIHQGVVCPVALGPLAILSFGFGIFEEELDKLKLLIGLGGRQRTM
jgi:hypothetical protein